MKIIGIDPGVHMGVVVIEWSGLFSHKTDLISAQEVRLSGNVAEKLIQILVFLFVFCP